MAVVKVSMSRYPLLVPLTLTILTVLRWHCCSSQSYNKTKAIYDDKLSSSVYHTEVRPVEDQSKPMYVNVLFELVAIVKVDDVGQRFMCNGFLILTWMDKRLAWDPEQYDGKRLVHPLSKDIWKPRILLLNTIAERDIFGEKHSPVTLNFLGHIFWAPGSLFQTSCELDMTNYPFDEQTCMVQMVGMSYNSEELIFLGSNEEVDRDFFTPNGEWDLVTSNVTSVKIDIRTDSLSTIKISFTMRRRPTFLLLNIVLPVVLLSFLNILVFAIPVESGEKVGYGITVLLALSVFLSIVSGLLPRSSQIVPGVTIYLFTLLVVSSLTVVVSIIIVFLHNLEEREDKCIKAKYNYKHAMTKVKNINRVVRPVSAMSSAKVFQVSPLDSSGTFQRSSLSNTGYLPPYDTEGVEKLRKTREQDSIESCENDPRNNKYRLIGKYIDLVSFVVFSTIWLGLTMGFLINISTS